MSSKPSQTLDFIDHKSPYDATDPTNSLKNSALNKVVLLIGASRGITPRSQDGLNDTRDAIKAANPETQYALQALEVTDCVEKLGRTDVADANTGVLAPFTKSVWATRTFGLVD